MANDADVTKYTQLPGDIAAAVNAKYNDGSETDFVLPLVFGITPTAQRKSKVDELNKSLLK